MPPQPSFTCLALLAAAGLAASACSGGSAKAGGSTFDAAAPETKAAWEKAVQADKTNDYVPAVLGYKQLLRERANLAEGQVQAVEEASSKLYQRLVEASGKGDPAARQALATLGALDRGPRPVR